ncbi:MAG: alkaline phosphatase family protein [Chloroflexota bacterium]
MLDPLAKSFYRRFREANTGWLRRLAPLLFASLLVLALGGAATVVFVRFADSITTYRSPLAKFPLAGDPTEPLVPQVVLVIIDGLRDNVAREMPTLQRLRAQGATATVVVPFAMTQPSWTALVTGAAPEINDAPLAAAAAPARPIAPESLFVTARRANLNTAIAAHTAWQPLLAPQFFSEAYFADDADVAIGDRRANDTAIAFIDNFAPNFLLVHYALPDEAAQRYGATGAPYRQAVAHTDQLLAQLAAGMNLRQSVLVVTSSHGHIDQGGYGGNEDVVTHVPLVLAGAHIKPGDYGSIDQADIAPTIAALVGGSIPSASQGSILFAMLDIADTQRAAKALALAKQQRDFGVAYLAAIGGTLSEAALNDPLVAKSSFEVKNYETAFTLAHLATQQAQHDMNAARLARIEKEQFARAPTAILLIGVPLLIGWFKRSLRLVACALMALGIVAMQHWLYLNAQHSYSFSDAHALAEIARGFAERTALGLAFGGLLVVIYHWRDAKPSRVQVVLTLLGAAAISIYFASIPFAVGYYLNGVNAEWYIGDVTWAFAQAFSLAFIISLSALAVPIAVAVAFGLWLTLIVGHRLLRLRWIGQLTLRLKNLPGALLQLVSWLVG